MPFKGQRSTPACDFSDADVTVSIFQARFKKKTFWAHCEPSWSLYTVFDSLTCQLFKCLSMNVMWVTLAFSLRWPKKCKFQKRPLSLTFYFTAEQPYVLEIVRVVQTFTAVADDTFQAWIGKKCTNVNNVTFNDNSRKARKYLKLQTVRSKRNAFQINIKSHKIHWKFLTSGRETLLLAKYVWYYLHVVETHCICLHVFTDLCSMCEGAGEAAGPKKSTSTTESAGGIQECPLPAAGPETATTDWGGSPWQQEVSP